MNLCSNPVGVKEIMYIILTRDNKYLTEDYKWADLPHLFPSWQAPDVMQIADKWKDRPTGWAVVAGGVVDLDTLEVMKF